MCNKGASYLKHHSTDARVYINLFWCGCERSIIQIFKYTDIIFMLQAVKAASDTESDGSHLSGGCAMTLESK
jgi:hypothetical protein